MSIITTVDQLNRRYRLYFSLLIAFAIFMMVKGSEAAAVTFMLTWIGFAISTLLFSWITILSIHPKDVGVVASRQDNSRLFIFLFVLVAAFISLFAIILLLQTIPDVPKKGLNYHIILSAAAVACSWLLIHTLFTLRYAHLYYRSKSAEDRANENYSRGLVFPNQEQPDFLDFAYFSFVLGMTFQVSDVQITSRHLRRLALLHGFLSFVYNTVIVAFSINIISGIMEK